MSSTIFLLRHAQPMVNSGRKGGLTPAGAKQARQVAQILREAIPATTDITLLHAPSQRCRETAEVVQAALHVPAQEAALRFRGADALAMPDVGSKYTAYMEQYNRLGIESPNAYTKRFLKLVAQRQTQYVVAVCNEVNIRVVLQILGDNTYNTAIAHAACYRIDNVGRQQAAIERIF